MAERYLLKDKTAIVTGAGAGIGYAIAKEFAKEGARVVIAELREDRGKQAADEIAKETGAQTPCLRHRRARGRRHPAHGRRDREGLRPRRHPRQ